jgi:hypothetical protein
VQFGIQFGIVEHEARELSPIHYTYISSQMPMGIATGSRFVTTRCKSEMGAEAVEKSYYNEESLFYPETEHSAIT